MCLVLDIRSFHRHYLRLRSEDQRMKIFFVEERVADGK